MTALTELIEALEEAIGMYMTPEPQPEGLDGEDDLDADAAGNPDAGANADAFEHEPDGDDPVTPVRVRLHILEMELRVAAERPLVPARWDITRRRCLSRPGDGTRMSAGTCAGFAAAARSKPREVPAPPSRRPPGQGRDRGAL